MNEQPRLDIVNVAPTPPLSDDGKIILMRLDRLKAYLSTIQDSDEAIIYRDYKKPLTTTSYSQRRSNFIGVFRNGFSWQAIISLNRRKKYLGSYNTQKSAARTFDFFSLVINGE